MDSTLSNSDELVFEAELVAMVGTHFSKNVSFSAEDISTFAALVGDTNPLHHDKKAAAAASFETAVASGSHTFSVMLAVVPDHFKAWPSIGLGASVRMLKPVRSGERAIAQWTITRVKRASKLKGWIMDLQGKLSRSDDLVAMIAEADVLFWRPRVKQD